jgi:acetyl esterase/lipase
MATMPAQGSLRSRTAATVSGLTLRQLSAVLPADQAWSLWLSRQIVARIMDTFGPSLSGVRADRVDTRLPDGRRLLGEWVRGPGVTRGLHAGRAIYYIHGSGYALCSARTHRRLTGWLSTLTGLPVFSVDYRLAPRHRFPTAADDVRAGWDWLTQALPADAMVIAGDSAGGHLAVDLLLQRDTAHPAGLALLSPLVDLTFTRARERERLRRDPAIRARDAQRLVELYCAAIEPAHPRLELAVTTGRRLPVTLIQAGGAEMLAGDAEALAADIRTAGGQCELQVWPDQVHVFQALPRLTPEAVPAMAEIAAFVAAALTVSDDDRAVG